MNKNLLLGVLFFVCCGGFIASPTQAQQYANISNDFDDFTTFTIYAGTQNNLIYKINMLAVLGGVNLSRLDIHLQGNYQVLDISSLTLWYSPNDYFDVSTAIPLRNAPPVPSGNIVSFPLLNQTINVNEIGYFFITVNVPNNARKGDIIAFFDDALFSPSAGIADDTDVTATITISDIPPPPQNFTASFTSSGVQLTWEDTPTEVSYAIYRYEAGVSDSVFVGSPPEDATSLIDGRAEENKDYIYHLFAYNANGVSPSSETFIYTEPLPTAPTNLTAETRSTTDIYLYWDYLFSASVTYFEIERADDANSEFTLIHTTSPDGSTSYLDTGLAPDKIYFYRVRAVSYLNQIKSDYSNIDGALTAVIPNPPSNLQLTNMTTSQIDISWTDNADNENGFLIERANVLDEGGEFIGYAQVDANVTSFSDVGVIANQIYIYRVSAYKQGTFFPVFSVSSNELTVITPADTDPNISLPPAPKNFIAESASDTEIRLRWQDFTDNEDYFVIERSDNPAISEFEILAYVALDNVRYQDVSVTALDRYYYRIKSCNAGGCSEYSLIASAVAECNLIIAVSIDDNVVDKVCDFKQALLTVNTNVVDAEYQWTKSGEKIPNASLATYLADTDGEYNCLVRSGGCTSTATTPTVLTLTEGFGVRIIEDNGVLNASVEDGDFYQWYKDYQPIQGAVEEEYQPKASGAYYLIVQDDGCAATSNIIFLTITANENEDISQKITLSPNPSPKEIQVKLHHSQTGSYQIYLTDAMGKKHLLKKGLKQTLDLHELINVEHLSSGMYFLEIQLENMWGIKRFVKL
jgi:fibronectin type 3 domain-containing protein